MRLIDQPVSLGIVLKMDSTACVRSNMTTKVGETTIASRPTMPERVSLRSNRHCGEEGAARADDAAAANNERRRVERIVLST